MMHMSTSTLALRRVRCRLDALAKDGKLSRFVRENLPDGPRYRQVMKIRAGEDTHVRTLSALEDALAKQRSREEDS